MKRAALGRARQARSERARTHLVLSDELLTRWILSRPVPRELLIDVLRADANYDRTSLVAAAHEAHLRDLRRRRRRSEQNPWSTPPSNGGAPTVAVTSVKEFDSRDPWSRRVPSVVDELQTLLQQVLELHQLTDEVKRLSESRSKEHIRTD